MRPYRKLYHYPRPVWRITVTKDTGESLTLKLYRSPFPQQFVLNSQMRSATSVANSIRRLLVHA